MSIQNIRFGEREVKLLFELEQEKSPVFSIAQVKQILGTSDASVKNVLKRLKKKHRIIPLQKGLYLFAPLKSGVEGIWSEDAFRVVPFLVNSNDYYVGFISAMNYWGMTEQIPIVMHVALRKQKRALFAVQTKFIFVTKKRLGDFMQVSFNKTMVNLSSIEQTILDALAFPEYCLGARGAAQAISSVQKQIKWDKLIALAKSEKSVVERRLGYLLELLGFKKHAKLLVTPYKGFAWLDPHSQKQDFIYSKKWGLKLNVEEKNLLEFQQVH